MYAKPSELLHDMDSHAVVNARILDECEFDTAAVPTFTEAEVRDEIVRRGLGGTLRPLDDPKAERLLNGWTTAEALCRQYCGGSEAFARYTGRGTVFRACLAALESAGH